MYGINKKKKIKKKNPDKSEKKQQTAIIIKYTYNRQYLNLIQNKTKYLKQNHLHTSSIALDVGSLSRSQ